MQVKGILGVVMDVHISPSGIQIIQRREYVRSGKEIDIASAQRQCASLLGVDLSSWLAWELDQLPMPPDLWHLLNLRLAVLLPEDC